MEIADLLFFLEGENMNKHKHYVYHNGNDIVAAMVRPSSRYIYDVAVAETAHVAIATCAALGFEFPPPPERKIETC